MTSNTELQLPSTTPWRTGLQLQGSYPLNENGLCVLLLIREPTVQREHSAPLTVIREKSSELTLNASTNRLNQRIHKKGRKREGE
jgi:hypothetical protein